MVQIIKRPKNSDEIVTPLKQFLTFSLGNEKYAIDIRRVQEIKASMTGMPITTIPHVPGHIKGFISLYNNMVPIVDLRIFYHLKPENYNDFKVFIILNLNQQFIGIIVDTVLALIELSDAQIKPTPEFCSVIQQNFIEGVGMLNDNIYIILDIEKMIYSEELQITEQIKAALSS